MSGFDDLADLVRAGVEGVGVAVLDELRVDLSSTPFVRLAVVDPDGAVAYLRVSYRVGEEEGERDLLVVSFTGSRRAATLDLDPVSGVGPWVREVLAEDAATGAEYASNDDLRAALAATLRGPFAALVGDSDPAEGEGVEALLSSASGATTGDVVVAVGLRDSTPERYARGVVILTDLADGVPVEWALRRSVSADPA